MRVCVKLETLIETYDKSSRKLYQQAVGNILNIFSRIKYKGLLKKCIHNCIFQSISSSSKEWTNRGV